MSTAPVDREASTGPVVRSQERRRVAAILEDLGVPEETVGLRGSPTLVTEMTAMDSQRETEMIEGTMEEKIDRFIQILADAGVANG